MAARRMVESSSGTNVGSKFRGSASSYEKAEPRLLEEMYYELMSEIVKLEPDNYSGIDSFDKWIALFDQHEAINEKISNLIDDDRFPEEARQKRSQMLSYALQHSYDGLNKHFWNWGLKHFKVIEEEVAKAHEMARVTEEKAEKAQASNITIFSVLITLITFLLSNVVTISKASDLDIEKLISINLTLLFVTSLLFVFLGFFLGYVGKGDNKGLRIFKHIILWLVPVAALVALILVELLLR